MRLVASLILFLILSAAASAQVERAEMTTLWQDTHEILTAENGNLPPDTDVGAGYYLGRLRLQDSRGFPMYELRYAYTDNGAGVDLRDLRLAAEQPLPLAGWTAKGLYVEQNPASSDPSHYTALYLDGAVQGVMFSAGIDHASLPATSLSVGSLRAKYRTGPVTLLAGGSNETDEKARWLGGGLVELPGQVMVGGMFGHWAEDDGFAVNVGRYNRFGDFAGMPSFSLNYIEVPTLYKWTNFRVMWGDRGIHYVPPTFSSTTFTGQYDINMGLLLHELVPDNYRHFDAPLLFKRYDEYGRVALRVNFLETPTSFRKLDVSLSTNLAVHAGPLTSVRGILSLERLHNPAFGWQDDRFHLTGAMTIRHGLYAGVTWSTDFGDYSRTMVELRTELPLPFSGS